MFESLYKDYVEELNDEDKLFIKGYDFAVKYIDEVIRGNSDIVKMPELLLDGKINGIIEEFFEFSLEQILMMLNSERNTLIDCILDEYPIEGDEDDNK